MGLIGKNVHVLDMNIIINVEQEELAGKRQVKLFGLCIEDRNRDKFYQGMNVETPFLYKSGYKVV